MFASISQRKCFRFKKAPQLARGWVLRNKFHFLVCNRLWFSFQVISRFCRCCVIFICDEVAPFLSWKFWCSAEPSYKCFCSFAFRLYSCVIASTFILTFDNPVSSLLVMGDKVWVVAILRSVVDKRFAGTWSLCHHSILGEVLRSRASTYSPL